MITFYLSKTFWRQTSTLRELLEELRHPFFLWKCKTGGSRKVPVPNFVVLPKNCKHGKNKTVSSAELNVLSIDFLLRHSFKLLAVFVIVCGQENHNVVRKSHIGCFNYCLPWNGKMNTISGWVSPNSITPTFQQSLHTLSKTQIMKVCRDKVCRLLLFVSQISHVLSCTKFYYSDTNWFVTDFVITVLRWFVSTTFMVLVYHFQRNLFGERQSNGIWALASCLLDCYCPLVFSNVNFKLAKSAKVYLCKLLE